MATPGAAPSVFVGGGVARRTAYHERLRAERADAGRAADELGDGAEEDASEVVEVAPSAIEVAPAAAHYNPFRQSRKGKQTRRKRRRASAAAQLMTLGVAAAEEEAAAGSESDDDAATPRLAELSEDSNDSEAEADVQAESRGARRPSRTSSMYEACGRRRPRRRLRGARAARRGWVSPCRSRSGCS